MEIAFAIYKSAILALLFVLQMPQRPVKEPKGRRRRGDGQGGKARRKRSDPAKVSYLSRSHHFQFSKKKKKREKKVNFSSPAGVVCAWKMMEMSTRVNPLVLAGHDAGRGRSLPFPQLQTTYL